MLEVVNVEKSYKQGIKVLNSLSIQVNKGDIFAFIGHNGAGKTTLIKCIVGILNYEAGTITINGIDVKKEPVKAKSMIAYIPDNPDIYSFMTGFEFLDFISAVYKLDKDKCNSCIKDLAQKFEIYDNLNQKVSEYSHGMKQKLVLISAFMREPKLMILDEPFVGLDPKASKIVKDLMKDFCSKGGAIFFSTHVLDTAEKLCNKVAIIKKGDIIITGTMQEVKGNKSLEDAFLGDKNE